jgi:beta-galactosidase
MKEKNHITCLIKLIPVVIIPLFLITSCRHKRGRQVIDFNAGWSFHLGDDSLAATPDFNDSSWRTLNLPHDWSIEGTFSADHPTGQAGGCLPAGTGWYRKSFFIKKSDRNKKVFIEFDGIYRNSEVWINGHYLGKRPSGYVSFRYDLSPYLQYGKIKNTIAVRVDNSLQPNSRWYTGSGIYRNVRLVYTNEICIGHWGVFITTPDITKEKAVINVRILVDNHEKIPEPISCRTRIYDHNDKLVAESEKVRDTIFESRYIIQSLSVSRPGLWSVEDPCLYKAVITLYKDYRKTDSYEVPFGIRYFQFDPENGFFLNGKPLKLKGVCNHHDLGALGAAVNTRAIERQLGILKDMGCNAIRTAHNPPAPELLDLCDKMGFLVVDEAFDTWKKKKVKYDYHLEWEEWHQQDLIDFIQRDQNHPCVIMWSIGNEIREQFDSSGTKIAKELAAIIKSLDMSRPVTCALTENIPEKNFICQSGVLDVLSFNYKQDDYKNLPGLFPGKAFVASETASALASRGVYNKPSDSIQKWPEGYRVPLKNPNPDFTVSAYDHIHAYWGSTHEATWKIVKNLDFMAGLFIWTGFDYLGEPVPYDWPARSSYYGIVDLAGFPKDAYYMYQSEWTDKPVLHLLPHWNWKQGQMIDIWAYYNHADEAELFLNGQSLGVKSKNKDEFHVMWRVQFKPGTIKVISRRGGKTILEKEIKTAGKPAKIEMTADRKEINADGRDLSFITVNILDKKGNLVPDADNLVNFKMTGYGSIVGTDNGYQTDMESFRTNFRRAFNGKCLVIIRSENAKGTIMLSAEAEGLQPSAITIFSR